MRTLAIAIILSSFMCLNAAGTGLAEPPQRDPVVLAGSNAVLLCPDEVSSTACAIKSVPVSGKLKYVVNGDYLHGHLTFLAIGEWSASLCGVTRRGNIICGPVRGVDLTHTTLFKADGDSSSALVFVPDEQSTYEEGHQVAVKFMSALPRAQAALQVALAGHATINGAESSCDTAETGTDVECAEDGGGTIDDGSGQNGGSVGDTGGTVGSDNGDVGSGEGTSCIYGPVTSCTITGTPTLPPDIPAPSTPPSTGGLCGTFGLNCPPEPTMPEPLPSTVEERKNQCIADYDLDMKDCGAYYGAYGSKTWLACKDRAGVRLDKCMRAAEGKSIP